MSGGDRVWQLPQLAAGRGGRRSATLRVDVSCGGGRDALWLLDTASLPRFSLGLIVLHPRFSFLLFLLMLCVWFRVSAACGLFFEKQLLRVGEVTFFFLFGFFVVFSLSEDTSHDEGDARPASRNPVTPGPALRVPLSQRARGAFRPARLARLARHLPVAATNVPATTRIGHGGPPALSEFPLSLSDLLLPPGLRGFVRRRLNHVFVSKRVVIVVVGIVVAAGGGGGLDGGRFAEARRLRRACVGGHHGLGLRVE